MEWRCFLAGLREVIAGWGLRVSQSLSAAFYADLTLAPPTGVGRGVSATRIVVTEFSFLQVKQLLLQFACLSTYPPDQLVAQVDGYALLHRIEFPLLPSFRRWKTTEYYTTLYAIVYFLTVMFLGYAATLKALAFLNAVPGVVFGPSLLIFFENFIYGLSWLVPGRFLTE